MRLATAILSLVALLLLAGAAYLGAGRWQVALYADVLAWTLTVLFLLCVVGESVLREANGWTRGAVALLAGAGAAAISTKVRPGTLDQFPFHVLWRSGASVVALGCCAGAVVLGALAVRAGRRGPSALGGLAIAAAVFALREWIRRA